MQRKQAENAASHQIDILGHLALTQGTPNSAGCRNALNCTIQTQITEFQVQKHFHAFDWNTDEDPLPGDLYKIDQHTMAAVRVYDSRHRRLPSTNMWENDRSEEERE